MTNNHDRVDYEPDKFIEEHFVETSPLYRNIRKYARRYLEVSGLDIETNLQDTIHDVLINIEAEVKRKHTIRGLASSLSALKYAQSIVAAKTQKAVYEISHPQTQASDSSVARARELGKCIEIDPNTGKQYVLKNGLGQAIDNLNASAASQDPVMVSIHDEENFNHEKEAQLIIQGPERINELSETQQEIWEEAMACCTAREQKFLKTFRNHLEQSTKDNLQEDANYALRKSAETLKVEITTAQNILSKIRKTIFPVLTSYNMFKQKLKPVKLPNRPDDEQGVPKYRQKKAPPRNKPGDHF